MLKELLSRMGSGNAKMKEYEEDMKVQRLAGQKLKSSNERELERFMEEDRQRMINNTLAEYRKRKMHESWNGNVFDNKNVFLNHKSVLSQDKNVLDNGQISFIKRGNLV